MEFEELVQMRRSHRKFTEEEIDADDVVRVDSKIELLMPLMLHTLQQLFAYYMAVERGNDVDQPRNLAKSVTVE